VGSEEEDEVSKELIPCPECHSEPGDCDHIQPLSLDDAVSNMGPDPDPDQEYTPAQTEELLQERARLLTLEMRCKRDQEFIIGIDPGDGERGERNIKTIMGYVRELKRVRNRSLARIEEIERAVEWRLRP
jgi:hypothetical protein